MGYFSLLLINHDAVGYIEKNPKEFWENAWHAINKAASVPQSFGVGGCYPAGKALCWDHMSGSLRLMLVGQGNAETLLYDLSEEAPHDADTQLRMLREAAAKRGYRLTKMPKTAKKASKTAKKTSTAKTSTKKAKTKKDARRKTE